MIAAPQVTPHVTPEVALLLRAFMRPLRRPELAEFPIPDIHRSRLKSRAWNH
ncbi:hypothetical protein D1BOALGB6SA_5281 [Olavius sp. associated proteobacterium Delta 1]|nr:hypothetical protein D1BOALGB6SA_5281 [Olavius sp. associated proteobacterium Delta 1]